MIGKNYHKPTQLGHRGICQRWLTTGQVARWLGVDRKTIRHWVKAGKLPSWKNPANGWYYFDPEQVRSCLQLHKGEI
jgi:predicted site-specific integrase-resolvase